MFRLLILVLTSTFAGCHPLIKVRNTLDFKRSEIVSIQAGDVLLEGKIESNIRIKKAVTGELALIQWIDNNSDGKNDELLFLAETDPKSSSDYIIVEDQAVLLPHSYYSTFSRFVPERTDDYAWENEKVAFRTYGPDAQQRVEQKKENGTLSSGIDLWFKRTSEHVINKWYTGYLTDPVFYHTDHGEGYDPYHVGASRGTGGTGIWEKDSLQVSKNFIGYKTIATGPLRTVFELSYAPYSDYSVIETKRISLDLGSNFSKFEISYSSKKQLPNFAIGITLHDGRGRAQLIKDQGIFACHEKIDGYYIGTGVVLSSKLLQLAFTNNSRAKDQNNLIILTKPAGKITYYAGFSWEKAGLSSNDAQWLALLSMQAKIIEHPLIVSLKH